MTVIEIWAPRWHDRVVLVKQSRIKPGKKYVIRLTDAGAYNGDYIAEGDYIRSCLPDTNGVAPMFAVPLDELVRGRVE